MGMTAAIGMMGLSAGMQSSAQREAGKSQQQVAEFNAQVAGMQADDALARGRVDESKLRLNTRRLIGSQRTAFAASGVDIGDGDSTASNVFSDTAALSEIDALTIRSNAAREAWGYRVNAENSTRAGEIARATGDAQANATLISGASSVLYTKYGFGSTTRGRAGG